MSNIKKKEKYYGFKCVSHLRPTWIGHTIALLLINRSIQPKLIPRLLISHNRILHRIINPHHLPTPTIHLWQIHNRIVHPTRIPLNPTGVHRRILNVIALVIRPTAQPHGTTHTRVLAQVIIIPAAINLVCYIHLKTAHR